MATGSPEKRGTWTKVYEDAHTHPKTFALAERLEELLPALRTVPGVSRDMVVAQLSRISCWCSRESESGVIGHLPGIVFAGIMQWPDMGTANQFRDAWHESGFVDDGGTADASIHGWTSYAKALLADRERKRAQRNGQSAERPRNVRGQSTDASSDSPRTSRAHEGRRKEERGKRKEENPPTPRSASQSDDAADAAGGGESSEAGSSSSQTNAKAADSRSEARQRAESAQEVFDHWVLSTDRSGRTTFSGKRRKRVLDRLKEGWTPAELRKAVDGCLRSPHHQGQNDRGTVYDDLELICRDSERVEQFIRIADGRGAREPWQPPTKADRQAEVRAKSMRAMAEKWDQQHGTGFTPTYLEGRSA